MSDPGTGAPEEPNPEVEVETDPTVVYVPIADRAEHPLSADEAANVEGLSGFAIVVEKGPRTGMTFVLREGNTTVGRHPESDIFLNDVTVSRHHCRFVTKGSTLTVEDSGSTNGTYVNDERVDSATLDAGDEVLVGRFHFVVAHGDG
ncbi:MAG TPA: FHA domain-containing protein [Acidimicrobiia bacterium]|jgi:pSer/pThr/pTyr-binding forkhead associated (FHA) protein|nr:FHA domain-containing protein [Acidimicrobiia bacterium]